MKVTEKNGEYQAEIEKRVASMDGEFIECFENINIKEMSEENDALPLFARYAQSAAEIREAADIIEETSYAIYDDEDLIGYKQHSGDWDWENSGRGEFASCLRILSAYLEEHAKEQEVIEPETAEKIEDYIEKITESIDEQGKCKESMWEFIEFVSRELNYEG